jgi:hypothetical protein
LPDSVVVSQKPTARTFQIPFQGEGLLLFPKATAFIILTTELARFSPSAPEAFQVTTKPDLQK